MQEMQEQILTIPFVCGPYGEDDLASCLPTALEFIINGDMDSWDNFVDAMVDDEVSDTALSRVAAEQSFEDDDMASLISIHQQRYSSMLTYIEDVAKEYRLVDLIKSVIDPHKYIIAEAAIVAVASAFIKLEPYDVD